MTKARRLYGTGTLYVKAGAWYGRWLVGERRTNRKLGPVRQPGTKDGLTRSQAERELRRRMEREHSVAGTTRVTVADAGERLVDHLEALGRKPTTIGIYRSILRTHLGALRETPLERVHAADVERTVASMRRRGAAPKTINNALTLLGQVFDHGIRKGWCGTNPVRLVDRPAVEQSDEIRFLDQSELEALLRATPDPTDRALFLVAAMTGLRQGELLALRWQDVDWAAGKIRVRRSYVRGHWTTPKSRRSSRAVPMADRVASELARHFQRSAFQRDEDLVFCHPGKGTVLGHSKLARRFKAALEKAGVREVRFHDLRHTFATRMAAAGVPMRSLQEWLGHRDFKTVLRYADYAPGSDEAALVERAFSSPGTVLGTELSETQSN
jgi:integrase